MKLPKYECKRCGHEWIPRKETKPVRCPKCKSPYWDKVKIVKGETQNATS
jgi:predicted Zn-ribbon and HTH transcriptional regulator